MFWENDEISCDVFHNVLCCAVFHNVMLCFNFAWFAEYIVILLFDTVMFSFVVQVWYVHKCLMCGLS